MLDRIKRSFSQHVGEIIKELKYHLSRERPRSILFDHIPKCAGSTLGLYLQAHYLKRKTFRISGQSPHNSIHEFRRMPVYKRHAFQLVWGHLAGNLMDYVNPDCLLVTVLREPVDRIVSHYYYARSNKSHYLHKHVTQLGLSLQEYVETNQGDELSNHYTMHFSGLSRAEVIANPGAAIDKALHGLSRYHVVGFQDDLQAFLSCLRNEAGLALTAPNKPTNVTKERQSVEELDNLTRQTIESANLLDLQLYQLAQKKQVHQPTD